MQTEQIILTVGTTLCGVVIFLFKMLMRLHKDQMELKEKVGELRGRQQGVEAMSKEVLAKVHLAVTERPCEILIESEIRRRVDELKKQETNETNTKPSTTTYAMRVPKHSH